MRTTNLAVYALLAGLLVGCGGGDDQPMQPDANVIAAECTRDPALLAQDNQCLRDEDCPCGAYCAVGRCESDCAADPDCGGGERCDLFGRCRAATDTSLAPPISATGRGTIIVDRKLVEFASRGATHTLRVRAQDFDLAPVRVVATPGLEISCDGTGTQFAAECTLPQLAAATAGWTNILVRLSSAYDTLVTTAGAAGVALSLTVIAPQSRVTVGVAVTLIPTGTFAEPMSPGVYQGFATPSYAGGYDSTPGQPVAPALASNVQVPVTISIYPQTMMYGWPATFEDPTAAMTPGGVHDMPLSYNPIVWNGASYQYRLGTFLLDHMFGPASPTGAQVELSVQGSMYANLSHDRLSGVYFQYFYGAQTEAQLSSVFWQVSLTRTADLPSDAVEPATVPPWTTVFTPYWAPDRYAVALPVETVATAALPLGGLATPEAKLGAMLCTNAGAGAPVALASTLYATQPGGDLACVGGGAQKAFGVLSQSSVYAIDNVGKCVQDLNTANAVLNGAAPTMGGAGCVDSTRMMAALAIAAQTDRDRAYAVTVIPVNLKQSALEHRLAQQWLEVMAYVAREAPHVIEAAAVVGTGGGTAPSFTLTQALQTSIAGWDPLLTPRIAFGLGYLPSAVLLAPDYRPALFPATMYPAAQHHTQPVGLAVTLLDTLAAQANAIEALVDEVRWERLAPAEADALARDFQRRAVYVIGLAYLLHGQTLAAGTPAWEAEWTEAETNIAGAMQTFYQAWESLNAQKNPLGIDDQDLPLYRIGDQMGALRQFFALSDYFLGDGTGSGNMYAIAPYMVNRAQVQLDVVRNAWIANLTRDYNAQLTASESAARVEALNRRYGEEIGSLCGNPDWTSDTVLDQWDTIDPATCFLAPTCTLDLSDINARLTVADVGYDLCLVAQLRKRYGDNVTTNNPNLNSLIDQLGGIIKDADEPYPFQFTAPAIALGGKNIVQMTKKLVNGDFSSAFDFDLGTLNKVQYHIPKSAPPDYVVNARAFCESARQATLGSRPQLPPASCNIGGDCPVGYACAMGDCQPDLASDTVDPSCFTGALGAAAVGLRSAAREIDIARSEMAELTERYDIAMKSCLIAQVAADQLEAEMEDHQSAMGSLHECLVYAHGLASAGDAASQAGGIGGLNSLNPMVVGGVALKTAGDTLSDGLEAQMAAVELQHEATVLRLTNAATVATCFNEAGMELVGARTAALKIQTATLALTQQLVQFNDMLGSVSGLLAEGHAAVENETNRAVAPLNVDYWYDEELVRFNDYMRQAKRATYLAVLSVEYQMQFSSDERANVLRARTPAELQGVVDRLRAYTFTGTVSGGSPADLLAVVSLRDHLLQFADRTDFPAGYYQFDVATRLGLLLVDPQYAVYDDSGEYLGQEFPFSLAPLSGDGLGDPFALPILAGTDCAERLWSVNASVLGAGLYQGSDTTFVRVVLRKRNTFFSQWCGTAPAGEQYQLASTRPEKNLFRDPLESYAMVAPQDSYDALTPTTGSDGTIDETQAYTNARVSAYLNITRAEMEDEQYFNGDSQELAGRGLYGDYALFFPKDTLSLAGSTGLLLDHIDDVLLRFDYVSVAQ